MTETATETVTAVLPPDALSPIQRAYLVGEQAGMELSGPARYYVGCDLDPACVPGLGDRLRRLVRANPVLRVALADDLSMPVLPETAADETDVEIRRVADADFDAVDTAVREACTADTFAFAGGPRLRVVAVCSEQRARLHLVYALWLMDAASLDVFLAALVSDRAATGTAPAGVSGAAGGRDRSARDRRFWSERAAALPDPAELPLRPDWRHAGPDVTHRMLTVDAATACALAETAREHGLTPAMVYLAVYGVLLGRLGGGVPHTLTVLYSRRAGQRPALDALGNHGTTMPLE
ncbi:condensation domain-containing protein, partial [Streptomyces diastatochromogenes]|uniref:condensation domain-containing protein n=1 Tax=Streptomyces diastatochromogenes TaxID=42236 RepID=UPI00365D80E5